MATEKLLVKTKDNCVMAFDITYSNNAERLRLKHECENKCRDIIYKSGEVISVADTASINWDVSNTEFLNKEISGYHYRKDQARFNNGMRTDPPAQPNTLYLSHQMNDDEFPEMIKNLGFQITPKDKHYSVHYNPATQEFETTPIFSKTNATVNSSDRKISITRNHFQFEPQDYQLLEALKQQFERAKATQHDLTESAFAATLSDAKQNKLFHLYSNELSRNRHLKTTVDHELKHVKNSIFKDGITLKNNAKRLQMADCYRVMVEDERSAYLGELVGELNTYLQKGDMNDFSMFNSNNNECVAELKRLRTPAERQAYASNWPALVAKKLQYFEREHRDFYDKGSKDERILYTDKLMKSLCQYWNNGVKDDFSMFGAENQDVVDLLRERNLPATREDYLNSCDAIVRDKLQKFDSAHPDIPSCGVAFNIKNYDNDGDNCSELFLLNTKIFAGEVPLAAPEDTDHSEFKKLRSLYYNYQIYNPTTHRMEQVNLAQYITPDLEVTLNHDAQMIIDKADAVLQKRKQDFQRRLQNAEIDTSLIEPAKKLMRDGLNSSEFVTEIDRFKISQLYEPEGNTPTPPPAPVPTDHADWSDDLQHYWQHVGGYSEIAKNNNEYKFKINDATVRYTNKKQVEVSRNADYALYDKMLKEPSNRAAPVEFLDTLSREQKLMLYIACVNNGRRMVGKLPTDLSGIERLQGIPEAEMNRFRYRQQSNNSGQPSQSQQTSEQRQPASQHRQMSLLVRQALLRRKLARQ